MIASGPDAREITDAITAVAAAVAAILAVRNGRRLSTKARNGQLNIFGKPKKKTIGDVVEELGRLAEIDAARSARLDAIDQHVKEVRTGLEAVIARIDKNVTALRRKR